MEVVSPQTLDHIIEANGAVLRVKVIEITDWDMDANMTKNVNHGLTWSTIRSHTVMIDKNALDDQRPLNVEALTPNGDDGYYNVAPAFFGLIRRAGGYFDRVDYNGAGHRGWITVWYVE